MLNNKSRRQIMESLGGAVDDLVKDLYSEIVGGVSTVQEAEITSRLVQRLEDRLDNSEAGGYIFRVIGQSVPDRGPNSMEKLFGADLYLSISLDGPDGFDKGLFIQAKYDRNIDRGDLRDACDRMQKLVGKEGAYVWIYRPDGVRVLSSHQVHQMKHNDLSDVTPRSVEGFAGRILDCYAGSRAWGVASGGNRRAALSDKLREARASNLLDVKLKRAT